MNKTYSYTSVYNGLPGQATPAVSSVLATQSRPFTKLSKEIAAAFFLLIISLGSAVVGILIYLGKGLGTWFLPASQFGGKVVNSATVGTVLSIFVICIGPVVRSVASGLGRAWTRRRAANADIRKGKAWQAVASGLTIHSLLKAPSAGGGLFIVYSVLSSILGAAFATIYIPTSSTYTYSSLSSRDAGYSGNYGITQMVTCTNTTAGYTCPAANYYGNIAEAFGQGSHEQYYGNSEYQISGHLVGSRVGYVGAKFYEITRQDEAGTFVQATTSAIGVKTNVACVQKERTKVDDGYTYVSACDGRTYQFGNTSNVFGSFTDFYTCAGVNSCNLGVIFAGAKYYLANGYHFTCTLTAQEGVATITTRKDGSTLVTDFQNGVALTGNELAVIATGFAGALVSDGGFYGQTGVMANAFYDISGNGQPNITAFNMYMNNAIAASAGAGLVQLTGLTGTQFYKTSYRNWAVTISGYGWTGTTQTLGWSAALLAASVMWFVAIIYMVKGGTHYDPSSWMSTVNMVAGSNIQQVQGTCTGVNTKHLANANFCLGKMFPGHVGISSERLEPIKSNELYGQASDPRNILYNHISLIPTSPDIVSWPPDYR